MRSPRHFANALSRCLNWFLAEMPKRQRRTEREHAGHKPPRRRTYVREERDEESAACPDRRQNFCSIIGIHLLNSTAMRRFALC